MHSSVRGRPGQQRKRFLRVIPLLLFFCTLFGGCAKDHSEKPGSQESKFSHQEVIAGVNLLTAIVDWPRETKDLQQKYDLDATLAKELLLPAHPLWDQKMAGLTEALKRPETPEVPGLRSCHLRCECPFYMQLLERYPDLMGSFPVQFPSTSKKKKLACARAQGVSPELLRFLKKEVQNYQAESAL